MITMIAHMQVPPENAAAYEELMTYVTDMVRQHEPGIPYYGWSKSVTEPDTYVVIEVYENAQVHAAHMASPWVTESLPKSAKLVGGKFDIKQYVTAGTEPVHLTMARQEQ